MEFEWWNTDEFTIYPGGIVSINEFLKEHRNVAEQQSTISELKTTVAQQQQQIAAQQAKKPLKSREPP